MIFLLFFLFTSLAHAIAPHIIIVPGTWSARYSWHQPGGDFFDALAQSVQGHSTLHSFKWSGKNNHYQRVKAAQSLADEIEKWHEVIVVAHSHGSNVGVLASQELAKRKSEAKITIFYALGTPVNIDDYTPDMSVIDYFYNLFSFSDIVQPVMGAFERVYPSHERIANLAVTLNGKDPSHSELHDVLIARKLLTLHDYLTGDLGFPFNYSHPGIVHFSDQHPPRYELDRNRLESLESDRRFQYGLARRFGRGPRNYMQEDDELAE